MHPALSVIFFTVVSGLAYGTMIFIGLTLALAPAEFSAGAIAFVLALSGAAAAAGLLSSMLHLGRPLRAWRAFSQWRSSWLSREGVAAMVTFIPLGGAFWLIERVDEGAALRGAGAALALGALITLYCTANIYRSLKTVAAWHNDFVFPGYLLLGLLGGSVSLWLMAAITPEDDMVPRTRAVLAIATACIGLAGAALKARYWHWLDHTPARFDVGAATGLARFGHVSPGEAPHTEENYLTHEMGFRLARKHAARLRRIALSLIGMVPFVAALLALPSCLDLAPMSLGVVCALIAMLAAIAGAFVERWLFFAEAKHVVMTYYRTE